MTLYLALDDTDMPDSVGTGKRAREVAEILSTRYPVKCITRHQFLVHPDIPYTSHNSGAVIHLDEIGEENMDDLFALASDLMRERYIEGSDPGLCIATEHQISGPVLAFGLDAKIKVLTQEMARRIAIHTNIRLIGLGGTHGGVIGALAGVALASTGYDGRYLQIGTIREQFGDQEASSILKRGIDMIMTTDGRTITEGLIRVRKFPQPLRLAGIPVLLIEETEEGFVAVRRD